ncbi:triple tyrosine motif-containing protein [Faecalimonas sp.]
MKKRGAAILIALCLVMSGTYHVISRASDQTIRNVAEKKEQNNTQKGEQNNFSEKLVEENIIKSEDGQVDKFHGEKVVDEMNVSIMDKEGDISYIDISKDKTEVKTKVVEKTITSQIVNLRKQPGVLEYTEEETGASGYTVGAYGADAAYLGMSGNNVKFMLGGVIGIIPKDKVQIVNKSSAKSVSHYSVSNGRLYHYISTNVNESSYGSTIDNGPAPPYLKNGVRYYSYDGHYFYGENDFENMLNDYNNGRRNYSVNKNNPFYNYFQYLPLRSQSSYSENVFNSIINSRVSSASKMKNTGKDFVEYQNTYGVNALLVAGIAGNESSWGTSNICVTKNNLFGLNAIDVSPGESANYFSSVNQCIGEFSEKWMSKEYLNPVNWKYFGGFLGNKASGINVKYASDPYWGEKAASGAWHLDSKGGNRDANKYSIGIKDTIGPQNRVNVRRDNNISSTAFYKTPKQGNIACLILDNVSTNKFYKIQSDAVLNTNRTAVDKFSGKYNFENMYAYISSDYVQVISRGKENTESWNIEDIVFDVPSPQLFNSNIIITPIISGEVSGLEYKYVWQKNDWAEWGILRGFSQNQNVNWKPTSGGLYTLIVDVKDSSGRILSFSKEYEIKDWRFSKIIANLQSPQPVNTMINIETICEGNISKLQYKYVWERNDWEEWGVLREFSSKKSTVWKPQSPGKYKIHVDIMDEKGYVKKSELNYQIINRDWELEQISIDKTSPIEVGDILTIIPRIKNENTKLQYKYVWERNDWEEWGVLQGPSNENQAKWTASKPGKYKIHVDVIDSVSGKIAKKYVEIKVNPQQWGIKGFETSIKSPQKLGKTIEITTEIKGNKSGLQYKYVWEKDDWKEWGVLRNFSTIPNVKWKPEKEGKYKIHVDVLDTSGKTIKEALDYKIEEKWKLTSIKTDKTSPIEVGDSVIIMPQINGESIDVQYKYVWERNDWEEWGVLQGPSNENQVKWTANKPGNYKIHVDVIDDVTGKIQKKYVEIKVNIQKWEIKGFKTSIKSPQELGKIIEITTEIKGNKSGLQYKYVWEKDNWKEWGTLRNFSTAPNVKWKPEKKGNYRIHIDVLDSSGKILKADFPYIIK